MKKHAVIISPSGNLYGSEKVLLDFLMCSQHEYDVFLPPGHLYEILKKLPRIKSHIFTSVKRLYIHVFFLLMLNKVSCFYCNEGGHIRYIRILAKLFPRQKFFLHLRIVEDCRENRLQPLPSNIQLIVVSDYLRHQLPPGLQTDAVMIHDLYSSPETPLRSHEDSFRFPAAMTPVIGVVGRITHTKGLPELMQLTEYLEQHQFLWEIHLFGSYDAAEKEVSEFQTRCKQYHFVKVIWDGFVNSLEGIYGQVNIIFHFSRVETLGRIFFEALACGCCFIGFNAGGIGEIARTLGLESEMIDYGSDWEVRFVDAVNALGKEVVRRKYLDARKKMNVHFSADSYTKTLEELLRRV